MADDERPWTCQDVADHLTDYLEGALSPSDQTGFRAHLEGCAACLESLEQMQFTLRTLRGLAEPAGRPEEISKAIRAYRVWKRTRGLKDPRD